jgi:CBS domain-containing protein
MLHRSIRTIVQNQSIFTIDAQATVDEAARLMKKHNVGAVMVVKNAHLVGIFTERDALFRVLASKREPGATQVSTVMTKAPRTIHPDKPFGNALFMMYEGGFRHVPVVENGHPIGMVSTRDALGPELREFGEEMLHREHLGEILG